MEHVLSDLQSPGDLALDLSRKKIYWTADGPGGSDVMQANLDGSETAVLYSPDIAGGYVDLLALEPVDHVLAPLADERDRGSAPAPVNRDDEGGRRDSS